MLVQVRRHHGMESLRSDLHSAHEKTLGSGQANSQREFRARELPEGGADEEVQRHMCAHLGQSPGEVGSG